MGRKYDIAQRIANANQRPTVAIDADHEYCINTGKSVAIMVQALAEELDGKEAKEQERVIDKMVTLALGKDATEYIKTQDMTLHAYMLIIKVIVAAFADEDLDEGDAPKKG